MAVDVATARTSARVVSLSERLAAAPARLVLTVIVTLSAGVRMLAALGHAVQVYFPDEYIYSALARSFAETGHPVIRGHAAHFPSLLAPLAASPFWLTGDPMLAYRLTQAENAIFMSLGAIPVYLLARRLGCGKWLGLAVATVAVATPDLFFSSFILAGPIAYPLVLGAVYAGVCALDRPTRLNQIAFVVLSGLAAVARIQYVILPLALVAAAFVVERGSARAVISRLRVALGLFAGAGAVFAVAGPARALGYYSGVTHEHVRPLGMLHWFGVDAMLLVYSAGIVIVPGALVGLALALVKPKARVERAFAAMTVALGLGVFAEAAIYASNGSGRYQERYLMALVPLLVLAFAVYAGRGLPARRFVLAFATGFVALSASVPLSRYTSGELKQDSPLLFAVFRVEQALAGAGAGALAVAVAAALLCALAAALTVAGRRATIIGLTATVAVFALVSFGAYSVDRSNAYSIRQEFLPGDRQWVDHSHLGPVTLVETPGAPPGRALEQLIWNRSIRSVDLLGEAAPVDNFGFAVTKIAPDGRLAIRGGFLRGPLLVENYAVQVLLRNAKLAGAGGSLQLWRPLGTPRADLLTFGRYADGWLAGKGRVFVWPGSDGRVSGKLRFFLDSPPTASPLHLRFSGSGVRLDVFLRPGQRREVTIPVNVRGLWQLGFTSTMHGTLWDGRSVSVRVGGPTFERS